ncbi:MAG: hypothetical protein ABW003_02755 [Microvirga sp.]
MRTFVTMVLGFMLAMAPAWSQERRSPIMASGEIRIPSQRELEREVFASPRNDFSTIDTVADGEMDRMDREIDRLVDRGICNGC